MELAACDCFAILSRLTVM